MAACRFMLISYIIGGFRPCKLNFSVAKFHLWTATALIGDGRENMREWHREAISPAGAWPSPGRAAA
jgi:hypothetical protein